MILWLLVPPVVFFNVARQDLDVDIGVGIVIGWTALALAGGVAYLVARRLLGLDRPASGVIVNTAMQGNTGYLGLPAAAAIFGTDRLGEAIVYDALVQGPVFFIGVFGVAAALGTRAGEGWRERTRAFFARNPVIWAVLAAVVAPDALAPDVAVDASRVLVFALLPLGFIVVGITLAAEPRVRALDRRIGAAILLRMALAPLLLIALAAAFVAVPEPWLLLAATPVGINSITVAHVYGLDLGLAASAIAWSTGIFLLVASVAVAVL